MPEPVTPPDRAGWLARNRATWNERAVGWDRMHDDRREENAADLGRAISTLGIGRDTRLLDAGCGPGYWTIGLARTGAQVTAIDLAPAMLIYVAQRASDAGVEVELREGDIFDQLAGDADATYDVIHCRCMLQFTPDLAAVLREFARVLKPRGRLLAAVPGALSPIYSESFRRFLEPTTNNRVVPWELERVLDALDWDVVDGWGTFSVSGAGETNAFSEPAVLTLPLRMQQAAATFWVTIAQPR